MTLQKHERKAVEAVRREWPEAKVTFEKGRASTHGLIRIETPDGRTANSSIGCSPKSQEIQGKLVVRNLRQRLAQSNKEPA